MCMLISKYERIEMIRMFFSVDRIPELILWNDIKSHSSLSTAIVIPFNAVYGLLQTYSTNVLNEWNQRKEVPVQYFKKNNIVTQGIHIFLNKQLESFIYGQRTLLSIFYPDISHPLFFYLFVHLWHSWWYSGRAAAFPFRSNYSHFPQAGRLLWDFCLWYLSFTLNIFSRSFKC